MFPRITIKEIQYPKYAKHSLFLKLQIALDASSWKCLTVEGQQNIICIQIDGSLFTFDCGYFRFD